MSLAIHMDSVKLYAALSIKVAICALNRYVVYYYVTVQPVRSVRLNTTQGMKWT